MLHHRHPAALAIALCVLALLPAGRALADASPAIVGTVASSDGALIAGAIVQLRGDGPGATVRSDKNGQFIFAAEPPGTYTISVYARGYETVAGRTVTIGGGRTLEVRFALPKQQVGALTTIVDVTSNGAPLLSTSSVPSVNVNAQAYAAQGVERTSDILESELSTTVYPILGGGLNAPAVVALRGPDPSETLVDVDGHQVNNGNTGDFDLSLLDPADLQDIQIVYGIAPSALYGPNTLGGALNVVTLQPTTQEHALERFSFGSFGTENGTLEATGSDQRFGYALSFHRYDSAGQLDNTPFPNTSDNNGSSVGTSPIGNDMTASSTLANLRYQFGNGGFAGISFHNQAVYRDLSAVLSSTCAPGDCTIPNTGLPNTTEQFDNAGGSSVSSNNDAYGLDLELPLQRALDGTPLTTAIFRHQTSLVTQDVNGQAAGSSPYLYNDRDLIADDTLEFDHALPKGSLDLKFAVTNEALVTDNVLGTIYADSVLRGVPDAVTRYGANALPFDSVSDNYSDSTVQRLGQTQRWVGLSYEVNPTAKLHYSFATYYSDYSSFGYSFDPRLGIVWTPTSDTTVRGSIGNTFQSPQLPTFIMPGPDEAIPVVDGKASVGNPNATAERATSMDVGVEHLFHPDGRPFHVSLDAYRTNLHNGVADFIGPGDCAGSVTLAEATSENCLTYPVNVTHEVYEGIELRTDYALTAKTQLHLDYDIDSAYIVSFPTLAADDVVPYVQDLGVPLHKINLTIEHQPNSGLSYYAGLLYEGQYNELNLPPYATLRAGITWHLPHGLDVALTGENLTNAYDFLTTRENGGVPYPQTTGPLLTPAYALPGRRFLIIVTHKT
ncbi:MAG TPA: TonB-dependent receptor [Candidatus Baltobacteraceae bacterium]|nr:TonB-dependent receptor [Candidatus Baltobacteraceae bacterium]